MAALVPCHCLQKPAILWLGNPPTYRVACTTCDLSSARFWTEAEAITAWAAMIGDLATAVTLPVGTSVDFGRCTVCCRREVEGNVCRKCGNWNRPVVEHTVFCRMGGQ